MISTKQAINKILENKTALESVDLKLINTLKYVLAKDVFSPISLPPFSQSAMDGYAISGEYESYKVVDEIKAGDTKTVKINNGEATRIFTGAKIPEGTTAIAKQEIVARKKDEITLLENVKKGTSIRKKGEEIKINQLAIKKGTTINPAAIGLLSSLGFTKINVFRKPKIKLIVTGNELVKPGEKFQEGKIYESNSVTIKSALISQGFDCEISFVKDDFSETKNTIEKAINNNDLVIITGGISVGDYDFVGESLSEIGVKEVFYKVNQKPGKPLYYGEKENVKVFALPGNPAAALTCFYVYVLTALKLMTGNKTPLLEKKEAITTHNYTKKGDREHLLKAQLSDGKVTVHKGQSSAMLSSFIEANCLLYIPAEINEIKKNELVEVFIL